METLHESRDNEQLLQAAGNPSFVSDLWDFLKTSRKWWMLPLFLMLLILSVILVLGKTAVAPFIHTLF